jgi:hypothetical protein
MITFPGLPHGLIPLTRPGSRLLGDGKRWVVADPTGEPAVSLDQTGAALWQMLDGRVSVGGMVSELVARYGEAEAIGRDVCHLLQSLYQSELVSFTVADAGFEPRTYHVNRSVILAEELKSRGWRPAVSDRVAELSMWWPLGNGPRAGFRQLFEPWQTAGIDSKDGLFQALRRHGLEALAPPTWDDPEAFIDDVGASCNDTFYVKKAVSGRQTGLLRVAGAVAALAAWEEFAPGRCIVQREVPEPMLIDGHKFNVRSFVLVLADGRSFVHRRSNVDLMPSPHHMDRADPGRHFALSGGVWQRSDRIDGYPAIFEAIRASLGRCSRLFAELATAPVDRSRYSVLGSDYLIDRHGAAHLLEFNHTPHLAPGEYPQVNLWSKGRMLSDVMRLTLGAHGDGGGTEFVALSDG